MPTMSPLVQNLLRARDAVADDLVDGSADTLWKATIVQRGGHDPMPFGEFHLKTVESLSGHARLDLLHDPFETLGGELARARHNFELSAALDEDFSARFVDIAGSVLHRIIVTRTPGAFARRSAPCASGFLLHLPRARPEWAGRSPERRARGSERAEEASEH